MEELDGPPQQSTVTTAARRLPVSIEEAHGADAPDWRTFLSKVKVSAPAQSEDANSKADAPDSERAAMPATNMSTSTEEIAEPASVSPERETVAAVVASPQEPPRLENTNQPPISFDATQFLIKRVDILGDSVLLDELRIRQLLLSEAVGKSLTEKDMLDIAIRYQDICTKAGYYLARIRVVPADFSLGILAFEVDKGRFGRMSFYDGNGPISNEREDKPPFAGKYYSETQLRRQLRKLKEDVTFDYNDFYRNVFALNSHPDIKVDTNLRLRKDLTDGIERRYADMEFYVREGSPFHGVVEVKNTGTESTDEWRTSITMQHLNLTRHNDILTVNTLSSGDMSSLLSFAASYSRPVNIGNGGAVTIYGGYSDVIAEEIVPEIDLIGTGWFVCLQGSYNLVSNSRHLLNAALSATYKGVENTLSLKDCSQPGGAQEQTERVTLVPVAVALNYSSVKPDRLGGRIFLTSQTAFNIGSAAGGSDSDELAVQRIKAQANYVVERLQAARIQPLFGRDTRDGGRSGDWILFLKADAQIASGPLVPAEQKAAGGMDSVRGYPDRDSLGDDGISGTIELRTPLFASLFGRLLDSRQKDDKIETSEEEASHVQFVAFLDGAYVSLNEAVEGSATSQSLIGTGVGLRLAVTSHAQLRFDWGFPLSETTTSESSGRGHVSVQAQF